MSVGVGFSVAVRDGQIYVTVGPGALSPDAIDVLVDQLQRAAAIVRYDGRVCCVCGKVWVDCDEGFDTCAECIKRGV